MSKNIVVEFPKRTLRRPSNARPPMFVSDRILDLAMQAHLLPTTLSLAEIKLLGAVILQREPG